MLRFDRRFGGRFLIAAALASLPWTVRARAQEDKPVASAGKPVAPKIKTKVDPVYPPEQLAKGEKSTVKLELTIDATGKVVNAKVVETGGPEFDAAALEAAAKLEFEPATLDGKPTRAKIPYRFNFDFKEVEKPKVEAEKKSASFTGRVRTPADDALAGARITITSETGEVLTTNTDATGAFFFDRIPPGKYRLRIEAPSFIPFESNETLPEGKVVSGLYRPRVAGEAIDIEVKGDRPPREVTVHSLDTKEITRIPGTNGDALKGVQNFPGVARAPGLSGFLIIRGSAPQETNIFVEGTLVPIIYHFFGLSSVIPSELLERIDFRPGNFGPEYGRVTGGIVDVGIRSPKKDRPHGLVQFDLIDGRFIAEGPIDSKTRVIVAGRRSWVDVWLGRVMRAAGAGVSVAPVYYDWQMMVERDVTKQTTARLLFFGSNDRLAFTINTPAAGDPTLGGDITTTTGFWRIQGRVDHRFNDNVKWVNTAAYGADYVKFGLGELQFQLDGNPITWRSDVRAKLSKDSTLIAGMDYLYSTYDVRVKAPPPPEPGVAPGPFFGRPSREISGTGSLYRPAVYFMVDLSPIKGLKLLPGVRLDYFRDTSSWNVGPRFAARYDVVQGFPRTTIKGGAGVFHQPPLPQESIPPFGTSGLGASRATHYSAGFEQEFTKQVELSVEGFYKDLQKLIGRTAAETTTTGGVLYNNNGDGRVFGMELLLRYKRDNRFFGWIAYTLSRAERRLIPTDPMSLFIWDQTHILTMIGSYQLGKGWEAGVRWRYVSGRMHTPYVGGVYDYDAGAYQPIPQLPFNSSRLPAFHQLDVRIDKVWKFQTWAFSAYLDVLNVYYRDNPEGVSYNYNYTKQSIVGGLPILPVIGIRGEL
jgi:TonB family protein